MEKTMRQVSVEIDNEYEGGILITQDGIQTDNQVIAISCDQVDLLIDWLTEAKNEIKQPEKKPRQASF